MERIPLEPNVAAPVTEFELLVHNFTHLHTTSPSFNAGILSAGRNIIKHSSSRVTKGWINVRPGSKVKGDISTRNRVYKFSIPPPSLEYENNPVSHKQPKEFGAPIDQHDGIFSLKTLDDFQSTDFAYLSSLQLITRTNILAQYPPEIIDVKRPLKQYSLTLAPLHDVLPQPHVYPSLPLPSCVPHIPPYTKAQPNPIAPYTSTYLTAIPPFTRSAWIIPLRGILWWDKCTAAVVSSSPEDRPRPATRTSNQICWTYASVRSFWAFLLTIRNAGTLGPLGLSFHAAPISSTTRINGNPENPACVTNTGMDNHPTRAPLKSVDHVKVYQDAEMAMHVRNVLDAYSFEIGSLVNASQREKDVSGTRVQRTKIRILRGSRLVLLDERSKGILIS